MDKIMNKQHRIMDIKIRRMHEEVREKLLQNFIRFLDATLIKPVEDYTSVDVNHFRTIECYLSYSDKLDFDMEVHLADLKKSGQLPSQEMSDLIQHDDDTDAISDETGQ